MSSDFIPMEYRPKVRYRLPALPVRETTAGRFRTVT